MVQSKASKKRAIEGKKKSVKLDVGNFKKVLDGLHKKGEIKNGMTLSEIVRKNNKSSKTLELSIAKDINHDFKYFKNDADRVKAKQKEIRTIRKKRALDIK